MRALKHHHGWQLILLRLPPENANPGEEYDAWLLILHHPETICLMGERQRSPRNPAMEKVLAPLKMLAGSDVRQRRR